MLNKDRAARVRENMKKTGLDQIVVSSTESVFYLTGIYVKPMERLLALYLTSDGETTLYANEIFGLESTPDLPVVTHRDGEDAVRDLAKAVRPGVLGIDKFLYSKFLTNLCDHSIFQINIAFFISTGGRIHNTSALNQNTHAVISLRSGLMYLRFLFTYCYPTKCAAVNRNC